MIFKTFWLSALFLLSSGCGIESTIPTDSTAPPSQAERAVFITNVQKTLTGNIVTCSMNEALVSPDISVDIFLEYQGTEIQRSHLQNKKSFTFNEYNPPEDGNIVCVVEFSNAQFESEAQTLETQMLGSQ